MYTTQNRCPGVTWEERERLILSGSQPLVIKNFSLTEFDDCLEDFIHNFLARYNSKYQTVAIGSLETQQCSAGRLRSLIDIFLICKHYFPDCTLKEVKEALYKNTDVLNSQICSTVRRRVYWIHLGARGSHAHSTDRDELNLTINALINE